jgi:RNA polymerase sigma-70 factor, ECF subfamily
MLLAVIESSAPARSSAPAELGKDVLARCKAHDPMAFRAFVVRYQRPVFALLSRMLGRGPHVEDLAQDVFLRAFRAFPSFDLERAEKPSTWVLTIATRIALDAKKRAFVPTVSMAEAQTATSDTTPERELQRSELRSSIERAVAEFSDDQRAAFVLAEFHGLSMAEIAAALDVPEATVKTRIHRARAKLQQCLEPLREEA